MRHLSDETTLYGLDPEETWVEGARERAVSLGQADRSEFRVGCAESLPWPDDSLDMVTCQTLLIHAASVESAVREMIRVLRPGGASRLAITIVDALACHGSWYQPIAWR
jgi:ubiquinone/menaquinone biosynthesis C-methylase UbiE